MVARWFHKPKVVGSSPTCRYKITQINRQKQILEVFQENKELVLSKNDIKNKGRIFYYVNTDKHLGETLSRMVKNNLLIRESKGKYKLGSGSKMIVQPKNQTQLFN